jgi:hypothetical protein
MSASRVAFAAVVLCLCASAPADAAPPWVAAIRDCAYDGHLDHHYANSVLSKALSELPADGDEYTDCSNVLRAALEGGSGRSAETAAAPGIATASGAIAAGDSDIAALQQMQAASENGEPPRAVRLGPRVVSAPAPASGPLAGTRRWNPLPGPLGIALIGLTAVLAAMWLAVARVRRPA